MATRGARRANLREETVRNEVVLRSSVRGPGAVLQSYARSRLTVRGPILRG